MADDHGTPAAPLRALVEELVNAGVRDVVICPGSRSTPLALALRAAPGLRCRVQLDERAAAFFALGMAKASRRPVAIAVTSGTAAVELAPAIVEARYGRVPLIALTADRPVELRDRGAPQTIDQDHLYGRFVKWFSELPLPGEGESAEAHVRSSVARAVAVARSAPAGPVHLNMPFREPLVPSGRLEPGAGSPRTPHTQVLAAEGALSELALEPWAAQLSATRRGLIVCGPLDRPGFAGAVTGLARATGFPIIADALSNVRHGPHDRSHVVAHADAIVRTPAFRDAHLPDLVLRFGGTPTSRALLEWLQAGAAAQLIVDEGGWTDTTLLPATMAWAEPVALATTLAGRVAGSASGTGWLELWRWADATAGEAVDAWLAALDEPFEGQVFRQLGAALPDGSTLLAGNSMPVRDMDAFLGTGPAAVRCLGNRGANGIDGLVATALGAAAVAEGPVVAVIGDVSFIHDLNALASAGHEGLSLSLVLVNNDGGGIFSFLPQASAIRPEVGLPARFEELFGTPHGLDLGRLVRALGGVHEVASSVDLGARILDTLGRPGVRVLEVRTRRTRNAELHRDVLSIVEQALATDPEAEAGGA